MKGWQVTLDGKPQGAVHDNEVQAKGHARGLAKIHGEDRVEIVPTQLKE